MKNLTIFVVMISGTLLSACAVKNDQSQFNGLGLTWRSNIEKLENGDRFIEVEAAPAAGRLKGATGVAYQKASEFCRAQNQGMQELKLETDTHLKINGVARLTFRCV